MNYPFEFNELLLTSYVLDKLGFTGYHDGAGDFGSRTLWLSPTSKIELIETDPKDDIYDGYSSSCGSEPEISNGHYLKDGWIIYFLHDLYECIIDDYLEDSEELKVFIEKCKKANCYPHLKSYLEYKEK